MEDFHQQLLQWNAFFSSTAQVSGGLVGLVFVALTFKPEAMGLSGADGDIGLRKLARQTFADFINVLLVSLLMLVPYSGVQIGYSMALVGGLGLQRVVRSVIAVLRHRDAASKRSVLLRFWLSFLGNTALTLAGVGLGLGRIREDIFWSLMFAALILLLISGARSAWMLVMHDSGD
ncbi:hypothetical protein [Hydrocarboniphaga sp.]|uniref:hypothetical protein n=1 Tax=Hydrocarboniphaga sp. TaxID=2033016 RepID=UPI003D098683